ncbi:hypothetical protein E0Z10_g5803 [Xylaria hypoxylon]|uniref:DUF676 domain-containing protein n=1 Tax=Xylaria hypoxylon TaxID=37992 RepID=A0A4Z0YU91_9PEZI|nr:hypothetical protein E0Z10_g5803 [Xylaria hypoxylon]
MPPLKRLFKRSNRHRSNASVRHPQALEGTRGGPIVNLDTASDEHPQGLEVVYEDPDASLEIVAIHGLNGYREKTWTAANGVHWLRDLLPKDLHGIRVLTWGYDANTHSSDRSIERPIIFVAHSLGGLVVKSALIHSDATRQGALHEHRSVKTSTYGRTLVNIASIFTAADDRLLRHLEKDSEWLQQQLSQYNPISGEFVTKFAYETYETSTIPGHKLLVVPKASAIVPGHADAEPIAINADHINMVRFPKNTDGGYTKVSETLQIMVMVARATIQSRWEEEVRVKEARDNVNRFTLPLDLSHVVEVPRFVAREKELSEMDAVLGKTGERRTAILHGLGGMGKTQLARDDAVQIRDLDTCVEAVKRWLDEPKNDRWIVVYDNYGNPQLGSAKHINTKDKISGDDALAAERTKSFSEAELVAQQAFDIRSFLPNTFHGAVIMTTRSSEVNLGKCIKITKLTDQKDSIEILASTSRRENFDTLKVFLQLP